VHRFAKKYLPWFVIDWLVGLSCISAAGLIWRVRAPLDVGLLHCIIAAAFFASVFSITGWLTGLNHTSWKQASNAEVIDITLAASFATALLVIQNKYLFGCQIFPSGMILLGCFFSLVGFIVVRYWTSLTGDLGRRLRCENAGSPDCENILIIGAGQTAEMLVRILGNKSKDQGYHLIGFVDDAPEKRRMRIMGLNVLGSTRRIEQIVKDNRVKAAIFAIHNIEENREREILQTCRQTGIRIVRVPDIASSLHRELSPRWPREVASGGGGLW
jgi:dTDP-glucose 4,6-dehydratase